MDYETLILNKQEKAEDENEESYCCSYCLKWFDVDGMRTVDECIKCSD